MIQNIEMELLIFLSPENIKSCLEKQLLSLFFINNLLIICNYFQNMTNPTDTKTTPNI